MSVLQYSRLPNPYETCEIVTGRYIEDNFGDNLPFTLPVVSFPRNGLETRGSILAPFTSIAVVIPFGSWVFGSFPLAVALLFLPLGSIFSLFMIPSHKMHE